ncbi:MAG: thioredoxin family protein [Bacteroidia bacterium]|nr:thioredoxin family protein [Bacteroidia bacterium]
MINLSKFIVFVLLVFFSYNAIAQKKQKPTWQLSTNKTEVKIGEEIELIFISKIEKDWYMYSSDFSDKVGPTVAFFDFKPDPSYKLIGKIKPIGSHKHFDSVFEGDVSTFDGKAEFRQTVKILNVMPKIKVALEFQECSQVTGMCVLFEDELEFKNIKVLTSAGHKQMDEGTAVAGNNIQPSDSSNLASGLATKHPEDSGKANSGSVSGGNQSSMLRFLLFAFFGGLIAVITPCVFPMLPMTVTFFTKRSETRILALKRAFGFGISIIGIYGSLGLIFAFFDLGAGFGNALATHWIPNMLFFVIFVVFSASFLGMFEITLPHRFVNSVDSKSSMSSFMGVFFMAFTLVLVSFSCTGPIVGSLLIEAVGGKFMKPLLGMASFGAGLALPFTLFAVFPSWIHNLPKSGGWLNSVKVVLGFLELALAFKFLSIPDQTYHWGLLDRHVYLAIWIVIFFMMGLYLLGKLKLSHDSDVPHVGVPRLMMAIITFSFVLYLLPGIFGAPLKALSGYLPPMESISYNINNSNTASGDNLKKESKLGDVRFNNLFHLDHGLEGFFDYKQAVAYSKKVNKPIFIDFTGHGCVNCREMEANVWSDPEVLKRLQNDYVILALYVDDKTELPENEWYTSSYDNKEKKTIGKQNLDLELSKYNANAQPYYVLIDSNEKTLAEPKAYDLSIQNFVDFLDSGKKAFVQINQAKEISAIADSR